MPLECRYVDSLRALGEVMMDSMESFLSVSFLCFLFLMVWQLLNFTGLRLSITLAHVHIVKVEIELRKVPCIFAGVCYHRLAYNG